MRHRSSGVPAQIARWTNAAVVNAGDGWHQHPTQALLDAYTIRSHLGSLEGLHIAIVGDVKHSRVARSDIEMFTALGARGDAGGAADAAAARRLEPWDGGGEPTASTPCWPTSTSATCCACSSERMTEALIPSLREYTAGFGLTSGAGRPAARRTP